MSETSFQVILRQISHQSKPMNSEAILCTLSMDSNTEALEIVKNSAKEAELKIVNIPVEEPVKEEK